MKNNKFSIDEIVYYPRIKKYGKIIKYFDDESDRRTTNYRYYVYISGQTWSIPEKELNKKSTI